MSDLLIPSRRRRRARATLAVLAVAIGPLTLAGCTDNDDDSANRGGISVVAVKGDTGLNKSESVLSGQGAVGNSVVRVGDQTLVALSVVDEDSKKMSTLVLAVSGGGDSFTARREPGMITHLGPGGSGSSSAWGLFSDVAPQSARPHIREVSPTATSSRPPITPAGIPQLFTVAGTSMPDRLVGGSDYLALISATDGKTTPVLDGQAPRVLLPDTNPNGGTWVANRGEIRYLLPTGEWDPNRRTELAGVQSLAATPQTLWALTEKQLVVIDATTGAVRNRTELPPRQGSSPLKIAATADRAWVSDGPNLWTFRSTGEVAGTTFKGSGDVLLGITANDRGTADAWFWSKRKLARAELT